MHIGKRSVLTIANHHIKRCGKAPDLKADKVYTGYFENNYREQLVFQYDAVQKKGTLWHGDYSWEHPVEVMAGQTILIIGQEEQTWLALVWSIATSHESKEFHLLSELALNQARIKQVEELLAHPSFQQDDHLRKSFIKQRAALDRQGKKLRGRLVEAQVENVAGGV